MKKAQLSGSSRGSVGKKDASGLRAQGQVPGVLYGGGEQLHVSIDEIKLGKLVYSPDVFQIEFELDGKVIPCIIQEMQFHPVTDKILHVDLLQLFEDKEVLVHLPVRTSGNAIGILNGGRLAMVFRKLPIRGLPSKLPEAINIDISPLDIGDSVRVRDIDLEDCTIRQSDSSVICAIKRTRASMSADSEEEGEGEGEGEEATEEAAAE